LQQASSHLHTLHHNRTRNYVLVTNTTGVGPVQTFQNFQFQILGQDFK